MPTPLEADGLKCLEAAGQQHGSSSRGRGHQHGCAAYGRDRNVEGSGQALLDRSFHCALPQLAEYQTAQQILPSAVARASSAFTAAVRAAVDPAPLRLAMYEKTASTSPTVSEAFAAGGGMFCSDFSPPPYAGAGSPTGRRPRSPRHREASEALQL